MNDLVWLRRTSWEDQQTLLKNIQVRNSPVISKGAVHYTGTGNNSRIFLDIPGRKSYDGMFKVFQKYDGTISVADGLDPASDTAGIACINGLYTEILSETLPVDEEELLPVKITLADNSTATIREGFVCLVLDEKGNTFFAITPEIYSSIYDGEFAVKYSRKQKQLLVVDGSNRKSGSAGHIFFNGKWKNLPAGSLEPENGYLCIACSSNGSITYVITDTPSGSH